VKLFVIIVFIFLPGIATSQQLLKSSGGELLLRPTDALIFEEGLVRSDLACAVTPIKPKLELDFLFHAGFQVSIPLEDSERSVSGNDLTTLFRVVAQDHPGDPAYLFQKLKIPALAHAKPKSSFEFQGLFRLGEGRYHVDWMMRDNEDHVCANSWDIEAKLSSKEAPLRAWTGTGFVKPAQVELFSEEPPVTRKTEAASVDVIVNFAPREPTSASLDENDLRGVIAILRQIARDPNIGSYSLVACSIPEHKVLHRQEKAQQIDFPAIREALKLLKLGLVDARDLAQKESHAVFIADVVRKLVASSRADALILVGPRMAPGPASDVHEVTEVLKEMDRPVFYLSYDSEPLASPWRDVLGNAARHARGAEYEITTPRDFFGAWSDIIQRIITSKGAGATGP
jgi:hypothetical protein